VGSEPDGGAVVGGGGAGSSAPPHAASTLMSIKVASARENMRFFI
jgi:hypothetical protein